MFSPSLAAEQMNIFTIGTSSVVVGLHDLGQLKARRIFYQQATVQFGSKHGRLTLLFVVLLLHFS